MPAAFVKVAGRAVNKLYIFSRVVGTYVLRRQGFPAAMCAREDVWNFEIKCLRAGKAM